jgi:hypothetical protein
MQIARFHHPAPRTALLFSLVLAGSWLAINFAFPDLVQTGIPNLVTRSTIQVVLLAGLWLGLARTELTKDARFAVWLVIAAALTVWLATVWDLAINGVFQSDPGVVVRAPALPVAIFFPLLIGLPILLLSKRIGSLLDAMPPSWLIGVQLYRILGGIFLVRWIGGELPAVFALPAGIGDLLVGVMALPVALSVAYGMPNARSSAVAWNILGILDLAIAVTMGALTTPGPLQLITPDHPNLLIATFPTVMTPAFAVPSSILLHALSLRQLRRLAQRDVSASPMAGTDNALPA